MAGRWLVLLLAAIGLLTVLVLTTPFVRWWARAYSGPLVRPHGDVLIVLSSASDDGGGISYSSFWRARYALLAWQSGGFKEVVVSGGGGPGIVNYLQFEGIPREAIVDDAGSASTRQNGLDTARLLQDTVGKKVLVTSDFHMFRAIRVFRKLGVDVVPMPVPDVINEGERWNGRLTAFETMSVESVKIVYYELHGWI
jgi:uncharacterized SAM-binding protein YcdF (DUF218 family)